MVGAGVTIGIAIRSRWSFRCREATKDATFDEISAEADREESFDDGSKKASARAKLVKKPRDFRPIVVSIDGLIGAGKTTLIQRIGEQLEGRCRVLCEPVDEWKNMRGHNLLQSFYSDMKKNALAFQVTTLMTRARKLHREIESIVKLPFHLQPQIILVERSLVGDSCFATILHQEGVLEGPWLAAYMEH